VAAGQPGRDTGGQRRGGGDLMRGQDAIIAARMAGSKPESIHLLTQSYPRGVPAWGIPADWVFVEPTDSIASLDLRFVVGCMVLVDGQDKTRLRTLSAAAKAAGASRVISHLVRPAGESFDILEIADTEGVMTWPN
jgi:hypothetical protein